MKPPYYTVIFTSSAPRKDDEYEKLFEVLYEKAQKMEGYLGFESYTNEQGEGCALSYWQDLESVKAWKQVPIHLEAQQKGKAQLYDSYHVRICKVEREYDFVKNSDQHRSVHNSFG